jgi:hypothetical protein
VSALWRQKCEARGRGFLCCDFQEERLTRACIAVIPKDLLGLRNPQFTGYIHPRMAQLQIPHR